jgi:hypothetical protein
MPIEIEKDHGPAERVVGGWAYQAREALTERAVAYYWAKVKAPNLDRLLGVCTLMATHGGRFGVAYVVKAQRLNPSDLPRWLVAGGSGDQYLLREAAMSEAVETLSVVLGVEVVLPAGPQGSLPEDTPPYEDVLTAGADDADPPSRADQIRELLQWMERECSLAHRAFEKALGERDGVRAELDQQFALGVRVRAALLSALDNPSTEATSAELATELAKVLQTERKLSDQLQERLEQEHDATVRAAAQIRDLQTRLGEACDGEAHHEGAYHDALRRITAQQAEIDTLRQERDALQLQLATAEGVETGLRIQLADARRAHREALRTNALQAIERTAQRCQLEALQGALERVCWQYARSVVDRPDVAVPAAADDAEVSDG